MTIVELMTDNHRLAEELRSAKEDLAFSEANGKKAAPTCNDLIAQNKRLVGASEKSLGEKLDLITEISRRDVSFKDLAKQNARLIAANRKVQYELLVSNRNLRAAHEQNAQLKLQLSRETKGFLHRLIGHIAREVSHRRRKDV